MDLETSWKYFMYDNSVNGDFRNKSSFPLSKIGGSFEKKKYNLTQQFTMQLHLSTEHPFQKLIFLRFSMCICRGRRKKISGKGVTKKISGEEEEKKKISGKGVKRMISGKGETKKISRKGETKKISGKRGDEEDFREKG